jgi:hypothetical protein
MSKGLGNTQIAILRAMGANPAPLWRRAHLQQAVWGKHPHHLDKGDGFKRSYGPTSTWGQSMTWTKNVAIYNGKRRDYEQNFTRALMSLAARGLLQGRTGFYAEVELTDAGRKEAERFTENAGLVPPEKSGD